MRGQLIVALALGMATAATAISAQAQTTSDESSSSSSSSSVVIPAAPSSTTAAPAPAPSSATSVTSLEDATKKEKKRKLKGEYYTENVITAEDLKNGQNAPQSANFLGIKYALTETQTLGIRQTVTIDWPKIGANNDEGQGKAHFDDIYLNYVNAKVASLGEHGSIQNVDRLYFPTGEKSHFETKQAGAALTWWIASYSVGKFDFNYHLLAYYYNWTQDSFVSEGKEVASPNYRVLQFPEIAYNATDKLSFAFDLGTDNRWYRPVDGNYGRKHLFYGFASGSYQFSPALALTLYVEDDVNIYDPKKDFGFLRGDETTYGLILNGTI